MNIKPGDLVRVRFPVPRAERRALKREYGWKLAGETFPVEVTAVKGRRISGVVRAADLPEETVTFPRRRIVQVLGSISSRNR